MSCEILLLLRHANAMLCEILVHCMFFLERRSPSQLHFVLPQNLLWLSFSFFLVVDLRNITIHLSYPAVFNNAVRLKCNVETNQHVTYTWYKDNVMLNASENGRLEYLPSGVLRINSYKVSDNGNYSCRAENSYKRVSSRAVNVEGRRKLEIYF